MQDAAPRRDRIPIVFAVSSVPFAQQQRPADATSFSWAHIANSNACGNTKLCRKKPMERYLTVDGVVRINFVRNRDESDRRHCPAADANLFTPCPAHRWEMMTHTIGQRS